MSSPVQILRDTPHLSGYQERDLDVVDYAMYELEGTGLRFRGPALQTHNSGGYFACIGAAQTFGCFCPRPYPELLAAQLGLPALNLGYGGAGPEFFYQQTTLLRYLNRARFVIVQVMSGRSQSNSLFATSGLEFLKRRSDGKLLGAGNAYRELLAGSPAVRRLPFGRAARALAHLAARSRVRKVVDETRRAWVDSNRRLLAAIEVPTILLWFSRRAPEYSFGLRNVNVLFGEFPQLVNAAMVGQVRDLCSHYVECISDRGSPQPLISRHTGLPTTVDPARDRPDLGGGQPWTHNRYYPSPEMHEDAATSLLQTCHDVMNIRSKEAK